MTSRITRSTTKPDGRDPVTSFIKVLSDHTRLGILELLLDHGELCVCEITAALCVSQPKASRHLGMLRRRRLILNRRRGTWIYYRLNPKLARWQKEILQACRGRSAIARWPSPLPMHGRNSCAVGKDSART